MAFCSGYAFSTSLQPLVDARVFRRIVVATVLFVMALPLEFRVVVDSIRKPLPILLSLGITFGILPLMAWGISTQLCEEFRIGLMVAAVTPCTLASAAVWTRRAGGNDAVAMMVTIATNFSCFLISPIWLYISTGYEVELSSRMGDMIFKLGLLVVVPMVLAQLLRRDHRIADWATDNKTLIDNLGQCGTLTMVLIGSAMIGQKFALPEATAGPSNSDYVAMLAAVIIIHLSMLWLGHLLGQFCGILRKDRIAVGFASSQKTLVVGLHIAVTYFGGLVMLPIVMYHISQLLLDTVIADKLRHRTLEKRMA